MAAPPAEPVGDIAEGVIGSPGLVERRGLDVSQTASKSSAAAPPTSFVIMGVALRRLWESLSVQLHAAAGRLARSRYCSTWKCLDVAADPTTVPIPTPVLQTTAQELAAILC